MAGRVARTMYDLEFNITDLVSLAVLPILINRRRLFITKTERSPTVARDANPSGLFWQRHVERFIFRVKNNLRIRLQPLKRGDAADVVHVRVRQGDCL